MTCGHHLLDARGLAHAALHDVDPFAAGRCEHEVLAHLALQDVCHVHHGIVHVDGDLDDAGVGMRQVAHAQRVRQVLVQLAFEALLVVQQVRNLTVEHHQVQAVEQVDHVLEPAQRGMAEHLAVDKPARNHHLRTVGGHEIHLVAHGGEQLLQRVEAPAGGRHKADARGSQPLDKAERLRRHIAFAVQKRAVHIRCDELDHAASFSMAPHAPRVCPYPSLRRHCTVRFAGETPDMKPAQDAYPSLTGR